MLYVITGGLGYIGTHTAVEALERGDRVLLVDSGGVFTPEDIIASVSEQRRDAARDDLHLVKFDLTDETGFHWAFSSPKFAAESIVVVHCAGLKCVDESLLDPLGYYRNNVVGTLNLLKAISEKAGVLGKPIERFVFSSSAAVYGRGADSEEVYDVEHACTGRFIQSPYGRTKFFTEELIRDVAASGQCPNVAQWVILRYFNPVGYHPSGRLDDVSKNVYAEIKRCERSGDVFKVFGGNYPTRDGTAIRDYVPISRVVDAHLSPHPGDKVVCKNIGTGEGTTVLELLKTTAPNVRYEILPRRPGDLGVCVSK